MIFNPVLLKYSTAFVISLYLIICYNIAQYILKSLPSKNTIVRLFQKCIAKLIYTNAEDGNGPLSHCAFSLFMECII